MSETYQLAHPITRKLRVVGGAETEETITEVQVRRLNGGDMRWQEANAGKPGQSLGLIARVTGLPAATVDLIDAEDIAGIVEVIEGFLPPSLRSGETSSAT
jgi:hypothetical protein